MPSEFDLIHSVFAPLATDPAALNLTDDAAVLSPPAGYDLLVTSDTLTAGVHFRDADPPEAVAARALAANASDLAAMAADPMGYTLALAAPAALGLPWFRRFAKRLGEEQNRYGMSLLGGDTTATPGPLSITIAAFGVAPRGKAVMRRGAGPGDDIWLTGTIGDAALGLMALDGRLDALSSDEKGYLCARFQYPVARTMAAGLLREHATAAIDISDGLVADVGHIADVSGQLAILEQPRIPVSAAAQSVLTVDPGLWRSMVTGGDDYELAFTAVASRREALSTAALELDLRLTRIGAMTAAPDKTGAFVSLVDAGGNALALDGSGGYEHFVNPNDGRSRLS